VSSGRLERGLRELAALAVPPRTERRKRARRELLRVECAEFALLLRRAAALRLAGAARADEALAGGLHEALDLAALQDRPWPRRLERLARCVATRPAIDWPSALHLARAAHALAPLPASRALVAEALAAQGDLHEALGGLARALCGIPRAARPRRMLESLDRLLAQAEVAPGDARLSQACARLRQALCAENAA
jgi:lambda repressor-like predicted transcriptional regulator